MTPPPGPRSISSSCVSSDWTMLFVGPLAPGIDLQSREDRTTKAAVAGPAGKLYLNLELRLHPVRALLRFRNHHEGRRLALERVQLLPHQPELRVGEAGGDTAHIAQLSLIVGDAEQQRGKERTGPARLGPAADDACVGHENSKFKMQRANATSHLHLAFCITQHVVSFGRERWSSSRERQASFQL